AVQRLAAAAGVAVEVSDAAGTPSTWRASALVLLGCDVAPVVADGAWPARSDLLVVTRHHDGPDPGLFRAALAAGARGVVVLPDDDAALVELLTDAADRPAGIGPRGR